QDRRIARVERRDVERRERIEPDPVLGPEERALRLVDQAAGEVAPDLADVLAGIVEEEAARVPEPHVARAVLELAVDREPALLDEAEPEAPVTGELRGRPSGDELVERAPEAVERAAE